MNFTTLSGVYENSRKILRIVGSPTNSAVLAQRLKVLAENPKCKDELVMLSQALDNLESHLRVMGLEEVVNL